MVTLQDWVRYGQGRTGFCGSSKEGYLIQTHSEQTYLSSKTKLANIRYCYVLGTLKHMAHINTFNLHQIPTITPLSNEAF